MWDFFYFHYRATVEPAPTLNTNVPKTIDNLKQV